MLINFAEHFKPMKLLSKPYKAVVVDNIDPKKLGRLKCEITGVLEGEKELLPWIFPKHSSATKFDVPKLGEELMVEFLYGDIYHPFYTGNWHNETNHDPYFDDDYPNSFGFKKDNIKMKFNDLAKIGEIEHSSGTKISLADDGSITIDIAKDNTVTVQGDEAITINGKETVTTTGDRKHTAANHTIDSSGNIKIGSDGAAENLVLGIQFQTLYNAHTHIGNLGVPSGVPMTPMGSTELASKVFTEA